MVDECVGYITLNGALQLVICFYTHSVPVSGPCCGDSLCVCAGGPYDRTTCYTRYTPASCVHCESPGAATGARCVWTPSGRADRRTAVRQCASAGVCPGVLCERAPRRKRRISKAAPSNQTAVMSFQTAARALSTEPNRTFFYKWMKREVLSKDWEDKLAHLLGYVKPKRFS